MSNIPAYSSARRISIAVATGRPSSLIAAHPACRSSPISASCSPFCPRDTAPIGYTRARFASAAFFSMYSVTPALSLTGVVFGMQATAVKPPATAAAVPVATVSLCSWPGSRRCTCMSMSPGTITKPFGISTTVVPSSAARSRPTLAMRSPSISTSNMPSRLFAGSTTRPPLSSRFIFDSTRQQIQHGHPDGDAVGDLLENHRVRTIGDVGRDLDAAVHRTRMHDDDVGLRQAHAVSGHAEDVEVFAQRREERALHAFLLDAEHHDHVGVLHRFLDRRRHMNAEALDAGRQERGRPADPEIGAELGQQQRVA